MIKMLQMLSYHLKFAPVMRLWTIAVPTCKNAVKTNPYNRMEPNETQNNFFES